VVIVAVMIVIVVIVMMIVRRVPIAVIGMVPVVLVADISVTGMTIPRFVLPAVAMFAEAAAGEDDREGDDA
jgi:hypothetical protein